MTYSNLSDLVEICNFHLQTKNFLIDNCVLKLNCKLYELKNQEKIFIQFIVDHIVMSMSDKLENIVDSNFTDKDLINSWLLEMRWPDGKILCPRCNGEQVSVNEAGKMPYWCKACRRKFSIQTGTLMEASHIPPHKWVQGCYLELTSLCGISSLGLAGTLNIHQHSAWTMLDQIRWVFATDGPPEEFKSGKYFRIDELHFHVRKSQKVKSGSATNYQAATKNMVAVVITHLRSHKVLIEVISENELNKILGIVERVIPNRGIIFTNGGDYFSKINTKKYHLAKSSEYFNEMADVNEQLLGGLKNLTKSDWSELVSGVVKVHRRISSEYLKRYVEALAGRNNLRGMTCEDKLKFVLMADVKYVKKINELSLNSNIGLN